MGLFSRPASARGALEVEALLLVPFLFLLAGGIVELGRVLQHYTRLSATVTEAALLGARSPTSERVRAMELFVRHRYERDPDVATLKVRGLDGTMVGTSVRIASVSANLTLKTIVPLLPLTLDLSAHAPVLLEADYVADRRSSTNPPELVDCSGKVVAGCMSAGCAPRSC